MTKRHYVSVAGMILTLVMMASGVSAQEQPYMITLEPNTSIFAFETQHNVRLQEVSKDLGLYKVIPRNPRQNLMQSFSQNPQVQALIPDEPVQLRRARQGADPFPNDPSLDRQWNLFLFDDIAGIDAPSAWSSFGTDGTDAAGNEVVIAIVDGGVDLTHPDLQANNWVNRGEIPGNNIDDDGNGYVDDVNGWDVFFDKGELQVDYHGTHVAGIIGAKGSNNAFISGVNWNIKIMHISAGFSLGSTSSTLAAYNYILKQKQRWIETGGQEGANVVAVNSSFGVTFANCNTREFSSWNDMYNLLGQHGILSVAATANDNLDIDRVGDVPTNCESPYLITVTNSDISGRKVRDAGYGVNTIDLAAPGENVLSLMPRRGMDFLSGTSMSTPHVAGAIGYLHTMASARFNNKYLSGDRAAAALDIKNAILQTVSSSDALSRQTQAGGILNLSRASTALSNF